MTNHQGIETVQTEYTQFRYIEIEVVLVHHLTICHFRLHLEILRQ